MAVRRGLSPRGFAMQSFLGGSHSPYSGNSQSIQGLASHLTVAKPVAPVAPAAAPAAAHPGGWGVPVSGSGGNVLGAAAPAAAPAGAPAFPVNWASMTPQQKYIWYQKNSSGNM